MQGEIELKVNRYPENPLITVDDVKPSRNDFIVIGAFNAGVVKYENEIVMLVRVAEMPIQSDNDHVLVPLLDEERVQSGLYIEKIEKNMAGYDFSDPRVINEKGKTIYLTSISHLRLARSKDGVNFEIAETHAVFPQTALESWGIEDCRITQIENTFYITYSAVSSKGVAVGLLSTEDFETYNREGIILPPENKDVVLFPEKINGQYYMLHRPVPGSIGASEMWIASSSDLKSWGNHQYLMGRREGHFDSKKIGGGTVPIKTDQGWLAFYHGVDENEKYCMAAVLMDLNDPSKVIARSTQPVLEPEAGYEKDGFFGNVVFSCGTIVEKGTVKMYYGAADEMMACAEFSLQEVLEELKPFQKMVSGK